MSVYVIGQIKIKDVNRWQEYKTQVQNTLIPFGGKVLLRGNKLDSFVGTTDYPEVVVIEFDSQEVAKQWYESENYQKLISTREKGADIILHVYG
jgi:uncharacterized protein (DUF1330 family)